MSQEKDKVFFRNFSLVVGSLAAMMVLFVIVARAAGIDDEAYAKQRAASIAKMTAPMGETSVATGETAAIISEQPVFIDASAEGTDAEPLMVADAGGAGEATFKSACAACHGVGETMAAMVPQMGDKEAWAPRIAKGIDTLHEHALNGFQGEGSPMAMPPKGGSTASDDEVKAAVDYMVSNSQ